MHSVAWHYAPMYVESIPNRGSNPAILLRESYREGGKVKKRTVGNISGLASDKVDAIRRILKGERLVSVEDAFEIVPDGSVAHGHVEAVRIAMRRLGFERLINSRSSRERDITVAMVAARIIEPQSKLATTRWWSSTTLPEILGVSDADEQELYGAMDWLLERQDTIEKKLASRHLGSGSLALYDLTSSYFEGVTCPLAARGHNRDKKKGKLQVNYGLLTNSQGVPVSVSVFEGNTGDPKTLLPQVDTMRDRFGIQDFVLVGDRGMITQKQVDVLRNVDNVDWISALRPGAINKLVKCGSVQMSLFDENNLFELAHPDFPGERLVACRNPELAARRCAKRKALLDATVKELEKVIKMTERGRLRGKKDIDSAVRAVVKPYKIRKYYKFDIEDRGFKYRIDRDSLAAELLTESCGNPQLADKRRTRGDQHIEAIDKKLKKLQQRTAHGALHGKDAIGVRVGKVIDKYKVGKHIETEIEDNTFTFKINEANVRAEAALDGIYVVRSSVKKEMMEAGQLVRSYKLLSHVEQAFRTFKSIDLMVRPIWHRLEVRVRAHIFLCMLAYYVQLHMTESWRPLLFADEDTDAKTSRDPVLPAERSDAAMEKVHSKKLADGTTVHSFRSLLKNLAGIVRNTCRTPGQENDAPTFQVTTAPNPKQQQALDLLRKIKL